MAFADYSKLKVLIVDDFDNFRVTVGKMLHEFGVSKVDNAAHGLDALRQCRQNRYDFILCDYNLGQGKTGQQVLEDLRHEQLLRSDSLFILVSAESSKQVVMAAYDYEPDDYLAKPVTTKALRQRLDRLLVRRSALAPIYRALEAGQPETAIDLCRKQVAARGRVAATCQKLLAELYCQTSALDQAENVYRDALEQRSLDWALVGMARVKKLQGNDLGAQQWLEEALALNPMYMKAYDLQAEIYQEQGASESLQTVLAQSAEASPLSIQRQQRLADVALHNNDVATAAGAYKRAVRLGEHSCLDRGADHLNLARATADLWRADKERAKQLSRDALKALDDYRRRYGAEPDQKAQSLLVQAQLAAAQGGKAQAEQLLDQARPLFEEQDSTSFETQLELAKVFSALGQEQAAQEQLDALVAQSKGDEDKLQKLDRLLQAPVSSKNRKLVAEINKKGIACYEGGDYREAVEHFKQALRKFPLHLGVRLNMAQAEIDQLEKQGLDDEILNEVRSTLTYVEQNIEAQHEQFERFQKLRRAFSQLERN